MANTPLPKTAPIMRALRSYDDTYLQCRNLGHRWRVLGFFKAPDGVTCRSLQCDECDTKRTDYWDSRTGERFQGRYNYAAGYHLSADGDYAHASDVRIEVMRRATVYANESAMLAAITGGKK